MLQSPLIEFHKQRNARLVEFAGWEMPILYTSIVDEHQHTRRHATVFDVSHMGRLYLRGADAEALLEHVCTRRIGDMQPGVSRYSHVCNESGGILDDVIVSKLDNRFLVVCNASNREKIVEWLQQHADGRDVQLEDVTFETAMVAIQGPEAISLVKTHLPLPLGDLKRYHFQHGSLMGAEYLIARSGYTGEDGLEVIVPAKFGRMAMDALLGKAGDAIKPAGLGARDTLRLEAGMPLYGHELTDQWDPITAGQKWCCALDKDFVGAEVLRAAAANGPQKKLIGLKLDGRRIARDGAAVLVDGTAIGTVTSGAHSPTLNQPIAMALVESGKVEVGGAVQVDIRGSTADATVAKLPFYKRG